MTPPTVKIAPSPNSLRASPARSTIDRTSRRVDAATGSRRAALTAILYVHGLWRGSATRWQYVVGQKCVAFGIEQRARDPKLLLSPRRVDDDDRGTRRQMLNELFEQPLYSRQRLGTVYIGP